MTDLKYYKDSIFTNLEQFATLRKSVHIADLNASAISMSSCFSWENSSLDTLKPHYENTVLRLVRMMHTLNPKAQRWQDSLLNINSSPARTT